MIEPDYDKLGPLLSKLGEEIAEDIGYLPDRAFVFVTDGDRHSRYAVYVDEGEAVRKYFPNGLFEIIMDIWEAENGKREPELRWLYFDYDIEDGKFRVKFHYPEEIPGGDQRG